MKNSDNYKHDYAHSFIRMNVQSKSLYWLWLFMVIFNYKIILFVDFSETFFTNIDENDRVEGGAAQSISQIESEISEKDY